MATGKDSNIVYEDLLKWQQEINSKDDALQRKKLVHDQALQPVRPSTEIILDNLKPIGLDSLAVKKAPTPVSASTPPKSASTPASAKPQTRAERAEAEKSSGNEYFGKKDFKNAIAHYSKAIEIDPTIPVYFVNRAMAYLKTNSFLEAEKDCTRGLRLQPKNVKALWRRGIALKGLGRVDEAMKDFETGLAIEPNNKSIMEELKKLPPKKADKKLKVNPIKSEPTAEKMRRLPINVIDGAYSGTEETPTQPTKPIKEIKTQKMTESIKETKSNSIEPTKISEIKPTESTEKIKPAQTNTTETKKNEIPKASPPSAKPSNPTNIKFVCPRNNMEFERDWKTYKGRGDDTLYQYFLCIPPTSYTDLFKSSLESEQFEKIIEFIQTRYIKEKSAESTFDVLNSFAKVKRINMLVMFLSKKHQQATQEIFDILKTSSVPKEQLAKVAKIYDASI